MVEPSYNSTLSTRWINGLFAGALGVTCVLAQVDQPGPPCLFYRLFHVPCPGCGLTRSFKAVWRDDWLLAFRYHPLGPLFFLLCAAFLLATLLHPFLKDTSLSSARLHAWLLRKQTLIALTILMLVAWGLRLCLLLAYACGVHNGLTRFFLL